MNYYKYTISVEPGQREILLALLSELSFDTFEDTDYGYNAYLPEHLHSSSFETQLNELKDKIVFIHKREWIPHRNWNAIWESNFQPIRVGAFCGVRAEFHLPMQEVGHEIVINPKMAFGTGHHATTFMMMQMMSKLNLRGKKVLDFGCGTGVLAILSSLMGAASVAAVDIELAAFDNTVENIRINHSGNIKVYHGSLETLPDITFGFILANINRNVILTSLAALYEKLDSGGQLLVSGVLYKDEAMVKKKAKKTGFQILEQMQNGEWICLQLSKIPRLLKP